MNYTVIRGSFMTHPVTHSTLHYCNFILYIILKINNKKNIRKTNKTKLEKQLWLTLKPICFIWIV